MVDAGRVTHRQRVETTGRTGSPALFKKANWISPGSEAVGSVPALASLRDGF